MSLPVCPRCQSAAVEPYEFNAGQNVCRACGYLGAVATFHDVGPALATIAKDIQSLPIIVYRRGVKHDPIADETKLPKRRYWD